MISYLKLLEYFLIAFFFTLVISPFVISILKREKIKQTILHYVDSHKLKNGTPTMGGLIFLISISVVAFICFENESLYAKLAVLIFLAYGTVGFLDDFIKFKFKRNLGLRAYQKIIFQLLVSLGAGFFVYRNIGSVILVPFTNQLIDLGWWIIPFVMFIYLAATNSVNLTDGLDGLATSTTLIYLMSFLILELIFVGKGILLYNKGCSINSFLNSFLKKFFILTFLLTDLYVLIAI